MTDPGVFLIVCGRHQGSKRCPALMRRARAGSVQSTEIAVSEKIWSVSVHNGNTLAARRAKQIDDNPHRDNDD